MAKAKEVAATTENLPAYLQQGAARGAENVTTDDLAIPRIKLLQALSTELKGSTKVEGAEMGMFVNTVTGEMDKALTIVPVYFYKKYLLWADRKVRPTRGLIGVFDSEAEAIAAKEDDSDKVAFTPTHIVLIVKEDGTFEEASLPAPSTKIKKSKHLNSLVRMAGVDSFAKTYRLTSVLEEKNGDEYYNYEFSPTGEYVSEDVYRYAEKLYEGLHSGDIKVADSSFDDVEDSDDDDTPF